MTSFLHNVGWGTNLLNNADIESQFDLLGHIVKNDLVEKKNLTNASLNINAASLKINGQTVGLGGGTGGGSVPQPLSATDSPQFAGITINGNVNLPTITANKFLKLDMDGKIISTDIDYAMHIMNAPNGHSVTTQSLGLHTDDHVEFASTSIDEVKLNNNNSSKTILKSSPENGTETVIQLPRYPLSSAPYQLLYSDVLPGNVLQMRHGKLTNALVDDNTISASKLSDSSIQTQKLANASVTNEKLASACVSNDKIQNGSITSAKVYSSTIFNDSNKLNHNHIICSSSASPYLIAIRTANGDCNFGGLNATSLTSTGAISGTNITGNGLILRGTGNLTTTITASPEMVSSNSYVLPRLPTVENGEILYGSEIVNNSCNLRFGKITDNFIDNNTISASKISSQSDLNVRNIDCSGNVTILGDMIISGTTTQVNTVNLQIQDCLIKLGHGNTVANIKDLGWYGEFKHTDNNIYYTGFIRDAPTNNYKLFDFMGDMPPNDFTNYNAYNPSIYTDLQLRNIQLTNANNHMTELKASSVNSNKLTFTFPSSYAGSADSKYVTMSTTGEMTTEALPSTLTIGTVNALNDQALTIKTGSANRPKIIFNYNNKSYGSIGFADDFPEHRFIYFHLPKTMPSVTSLLTIDNAGQLDYTNITAGGGSQTSLLDTMQPIISLSLRRINPNFDAWVLWVKRTTPDRYAFVFFDTQGKISHNSPTDQTSDGITFQNLQTFAAGSSILTILRWNNQYNRIQYGGYPFYFQANNSYTAQPTLILGSGIGSDESYVQFSTTTNVASLVNIMSQQHATRALTICFRHSHSATGSQYLFNTSTSGNWTYQFGAPETGQIRGWWTGSTTPGIAYSDNAWGCASLIYNCEGANNYMIGRYNNNSTVYVSNSGINLSPVINHVCTIGNSNFDLREIIFYHSYPKASDVMAMHTQICQYWSF